MSSYSQLASFIRSTFSEPTEFIPLHDPRFIGNEKKVPQRMHRFPNILYNIGIIFHICKLKT